jgi:ATP-binding cassette subfamily C protein CydD
LIVRRGERVIGPVDLSVSAGEIVLMDGPSGAGKSSILAALLGFLPAEGEVRAIPGADGPAARGVLAWAGQRAGLLSGTIAENVSLGDERPDGERVARCLADALVDVPASVVLGASGAGISGGQAQRVAVARALYRLRSGRARVLALDEPSSALDGDTEASLWRMLRRVADTERVGILLVSHRRSAQSIADRVVHLPAGAVARADQGGRA